MELQERSWDVKTRIPNSLLQLTPVTQLELHSEYAAIYSDLVNTYYPEGLSQEHCVEMMATAMWCERRAVSAETTAYNLDYADQARNQQAARCILPDGYTAAEQTALSLDRIHRESDFYNFLLRYKLTQAKIYESALRRLEKLKQDKVQYEPKLAASDTDEYESSASLERRMREFNLRELQNEPKKVA